MVRMGMIMLEVGKGCYRMIGVGVKKIKVVQINIDIFCCWKEINLKKEVVIINLSFNRFFKEKRKERRGNYRISWFLWSYFNF